MWRDRLLPGLAAWLAAAAPAQAYVAYVSNEKGNTVSVIDTDNWTVTDTIKVGQRPRGIEFSRDGKFVMVAVGDDDTIDVIDTTPSCSPRTPPARSSTSPMRTTTRSP
jgi:YVTN family beta-propeller protein